jgi:AcrR family transcriptional regulator
MDVTICHSWHLVSITPRRLAFGMPTTRGPSLRERSRRAIQAELLQVAQRLFVEQGYPETTVDQIAAAAGMSRRTIFRYVSSKEELVLAKYDLLQEDLVQRLTDRPAAEPLWTSLRRMFDGVVEYLSDPSNASPAAVVQRIVAGTPALHAGSLVRLARMQHAIRRIVEQRQADVTSVAAGAIVGAAFACLATAQEHSVRTGGALAASLDEAMGVLRIARSSGRRS